MSPRFGAGASLPDLTGTFVDDGFFQLVALLGSGSSANVYKALDTTSPEEAPIYYAVKCMRNDAPGSKRDATLRNEFKTHKAVSDQPGVVKFHGVFAGGEEGEFIFMVLDVGSTTLGDVVGKHTFVDRPGYIRHTFLQLVESVSECHRSGVYHRDLKPANILCNSWGMGIRLADFGTATVDKESTMFQCGSSAHMSPECADASRASYSPRESDLWALGVVLFTLVTGTTPWAVADPSDPKYAAYRANETHYLAEVFHLSGAANDFFRWCFAPAPADRPTLNQMYDAVLDIGRFATARLSSLPTPTVMLPASAPRVQNSPEFRFIDRRKQSITTRARFANKLQRVY